MNESHLMQQLMQTWQSLASLGGWYQDAFLMLICVIAGVMLFLTGMVLGLFFQSLWGIFFISRQQADNESP